MPWTHLTQRPFVHAFRVVPKKHAPVVRADHWVQGGTARPPEVYSSFRKFDDSRIAKLLDWGARHASANYPLRTATMDNTNVSRSFVDVSSEISTQDHLPYSYLAEHKYFICHYFEFNSMYATRAPGGGHHWDLDNRRQPSTLKHAQESEGVPVSTEAQFDTNTQLSPPDFLWETRFVVMQLRTLQVCALMRQNSRDGMEAMPPLTAGVFGLDQPLCSPSLHAYAQRATKDRNIHSNGSVELNGGEVHRRETTSTIFERT